MRIRLVFQSTDRPFDSKAHRRVAVGAESFPQRGEMGGIPGIAKRHCGVTPENIEIGYVVVHNRFDNGSIVVVIKIEDLFQIELVSDLIEECIPSFEPMKHVMIARTRKLALIATVDALPHAFPDAFLCPGSESLVVEEYASVKQKPAWGRNRPSRAGAYAGSAPAWAFAFQRRLVIRQALIDEKRDQNDKRTVFRSVCEIISAERHYAGFGAS